MIGRLLRALAAAVAVLGLTACAAHLYQSRGAEALPPAAPDTLRIATYNVHYILLNRAEGPWSVADWEARKGPLDAAFKTLEADIVAFQEMESFAGGNDGAVNLARDWLLARNPGYAAAASGDWRVFPSTQPILYRTDRLRLRDQGWFFFSDTPDVIYSRTFNGSYPAFASWAAFETRAGRVFRVVNVHFEYSSRANRLKSADLVAARLRPVIAGGTPVVLAGDLNARHGAETMRRLEAAGLTFAPVPGATYHLNRGLHLFGAIDHLGVTDQFVLRAGPVVVQRRFDGIWPSDHHPVVADVALP